LKISSQEEYGLRCILQLARERTEPLSLAEIAGREGLSSAYVAKLMGQMRDAGLVEAVRGRSGGYTLARSPEEINVHEVLTAFSGQLFQGSFCDEHPGAGETCVHQGSLCNIKSLWGVLDGLIGTVLSRTSLADLLCFGRVEKVFEEPRRLLVAGSPPRSS